MAYLRGFEPPTFGSGVWSRHLARGTIGLGFHVWNENGCCRDERGWEFFLNESA